MVIITSDYLKMLRKKAGLSQTALAEKISISQAHIAKIERGRVNPTLGTINKILIAIRPRETQKCKDIMEHHLRFLGQNDDARKALLMMRKYRISQLPVIKNNVQVGSISEGTLLKNFENMKDKKVKDIMDSSFPIVDENDDIGILPSLLEFHQAVLVSAKGKLQGIITKLDILR